MNSVRRRLRYSLRLLLVCLTIVTVIVAIYREPLREQAEELRERWQRFLAGDSEARLVDRIVIVGPQTVGLPGVPTPPSPDEILRALRKAGAINQVPRNVRLLLEPTADYVDPPRVYPRIGPAQLQHSHYKCRVISDDGEKTVYLDFNHLCVPPGSSASGSD